MAQMFDEACPSYLAMGMSYEQYWDGPGDLARVYREAHDIMQVQKNHELWLQGLYVHQAVSVAVNNLFRKKGAKPKGYLDKPLPVTRREQREQRRMEEQSRYKRIRGAFERMMAGVNARFKKNGGEGE